MYFHRCLMINNCCLIITVVTRIYGKNVTLNNSNNDSDFVSMITKFRNYSVTSVKKILPQDYNVFHFFNLIYKVCSIYYIHVLFYLFSGFFCFRYVLIVNEVGTEYLLALFLSLWVYHSRAIIIICDYSRNWDETIWINCS